MARISSLALLLSVALISATGARAQTKPLAAGETAPDFTLVDHQGKKVTLSAAKDKSPVVLVFYRGYW